jgi:hypothetical protein
MSKSTIVRFPDLFWRYIRATRLAGIWRALTSSAGWAGQTVFLAPCYFGLRHGKLSPYLWDAQLCMAQRPEAFRTSRSSCLIIRLGVTCQTSGAWLSCIALAVSKRASNQEPGRCNGPTGRQPADHDAGAGKGAGQIYMAGLAKSLAIAALTTISFYKRTLNTNRHLYW